MSIANGLRQLFPNADPVRDYEVRQDAPGQEPYLAAWRLPDPRPTAQQLADAATAYDTAQQQAAQAEAARQQADEADRAAARALVVQTAQGAVGLNYTALSNIQVRALVAILLWQEGAIDATGVVRPLASWVR